MAKLNAAARKALPSSTFAGPGRSYPIPDRSHAIAAKSMAARYASPSVKAQVDAKANQMLSKSTIHHKPGCGGNHLGNC